jgi:xyloglucan-specific endo-beta-1,4-glucanase
MKICHRHSYKCTKWRLTRIALILSYNNLWGASTGTGSQCLWDRSRSSSHISWETRWDWSGRGDTIKSYAAAVLGWHWGCKIPDTGLPIRLDRARGIPASWRFELTQTLFSRLNVTYDIWLSTQANVGNEAPFGEVMIWLNHTDGVIPFGSKQITVAIAQAEWDLWKGPHPESGWPVYSFVRTIDTTTETFDLLDFLRYLVPRYLDPHTYVVGIEAGVEVFVGAGALQTTVYSVDIDTEPPGNASA